MDVKPDSDAVETGSEGVREEVDYKAEALRYKQLYLETKEESIKRKKQLRERPKVQSDSKPVAGAKPVESDERYALLLAENRVLKHQAGFLEVAKSLGVRGDVSASKLMKIADYEPEDDDFDRKAVKRLIEGLRETDGYLFSRSSDDSEDVKVEPTEVARKLDRAGGRGSDTQAAPGEVRIPKDPATIRKLMEDNRRKALEAGKARRW